MIVELRWETELERDIVEQIQRDWLLYGEIHITNAHGVTRLDPTGVTYRYDVRLDVRKDATP